MPDRPTDPADATPDGAPADPGVPSEEARRRTDGDRWQAALDSWSGPAAEPEGGTREIRLDGTPSSWEQTAQQPSVPEDQRPWDQQSAEHIAAWQQPPSWQQEAHAQQGAQNRQPPVETPPAASPAPEQAAEPSWRPADQPVGQPPSWEQQSWDNRSWEQQVPAQPAPAPPQSGPAQQPAAQQEWGQQPSGGWGSQGSTSWTPPGGAPAAAPPSLTSQSLLRQAPETPTRGWRRFVHKATGGSYNPGLSQAEIEHRAMVARVTTPVRGSNRIAVVSLKGGIGKTTTTCCLGLTLAHHRGDRVVAVDANPDAGTLAERLTNVTDVTVRDLLSAKDRIRSFTDVSAYTSLAGRLQVLASDQDPALSEAFSEEEYTTVADILARYFNIILTDSGTGLLHSAMSGTLAIADSLVVVGAPSVDGASRASKTLDWLIAHGHEELVARSVAVISSVRPNTGDVDMGMVRDHFAARCRAVVEIPYDAHLVTGGLINLDRVGAPARKAYLELAAHVADGFALPPLQRRPA
ncbi:MinD/ParA family protein [Klenkia sp. PcliD-1-E]|uniref:MinD/ParA family ATP-binding protein n=1 Tax=Klenkia sp. PcliD-1-E TaxID=2954492 RepID=UPI0020982712|nr:MinD/ParA family protein [Klenkia sp. PcliD-1-E]MCO7221150.1 AAA family ATPase [Klenkia sp. PcliD-1-E]